MSSGSKKYVEWLEYAREARADAEKILRHIGTSGAATGLIDEGGVYALVRFSPIDEVALEHFRNWDSSHGFPWSDAPQVIAKSSRHFDLALWYGDQLCGLCFGTPSGRRTLVRIMLLEGHPSSSSVFHPLKGKVVSLCLLAVSSYCKRIGATKIVIDKPLQGAVDIYRKHRFNYVEGELVLDLG